MGIEVHTAQSFAILENTALDIASWCLTIWYVEQSALIPLQIKTIYIICDTEQGGTLVILYMLLNYPSQNPSQLVMLPEVLGV